MHPSASDTAADPTRLRKIAGRQRLVMITVISTFAANILFLACRELGPEALFLAGC